MIEYLILSSIKDDDEMLCLDTAKDSVQGKDAFDRILAEGLFDGDLLLVKVVRSAELSYDVREHSEESEEDITETVRGTGNSRLYALPGSGC